jgi:hypothetical protein
MMYWFKRIQGVKWVGIFIVVVILIAWCYGSQENQAVSGGVVYFKGRTLPNVPSGGNETDEGWYFKPGYPDYAINGIPDFCQKQSTWFVTVSQGRRWTHCGPVALGNCLWWFDSKFEPGTIQPPAVSDGYPLVSSYGSWDDHATQNVIPFINQLAGYVHTGSAGTNVDSLYHGVINYLVYKGLINDYTVNLYPRPNTELVCSEVLRSQDVILLLGFWEQNATGGWHRIGGHYVTVAGVDSNCTQIAISDPFFDWAEYGNPVRFGNGILIPHSPIPGHGPEVHNDAGNISHDGYIIVHNSPSPGGDWWLPEYPITYNPDSVYAFAGLNCPAEFVQYQGTWQGGMIHTEVEYALIICPVEQRELDFGDAPDPSYPSLLANNGARHQDFSYEWLGTGVDGEADSRQVDLDNFDDGVIFYPPYISGGTGQVGLIVSVTNPWGGRYTAAHPIYLHGWFDWLGDGDWNDPGENAFSGVAVNPAMWSSGQTSDTVIISFTIPAGISVADSIWTRFRLDYNQNLNSVYGLADFGEVEDHLLIQEQPPLEWYFKPGYPDYAPSGMPDFDQKQDGWVTPGTNRWNHCGPVALANCLWWFDSKFETGTVPPPTISDHYNLVTAYGTWDDHDTSNVRPLVDSLAGYVQTGPFGTTINHMYSGVINYLNHVGLRPYYDVNLYNMVSWDFVCDEVRRSQDVILLLGFWESLGQNEWQRVGGHYVTMAGVDTNCTWVAFSDPFFDRAEQGRPVRYLGHIPIPGGHPSWVHNNASCISHDGFLVMRNHTGPGGSCWLPVYANQLGPDQIENFDFQNCPDEFQSMQGHWTGGGIHVVLEYALVICPATPREMDFGDAPDPTYPSLLASNGARHTNPSFEWLGDSVDVETNSRQVNLDNFDDGVIFHPPYISGGTGQADVIVTVSNPASSRYSPNSLIYIHGWIDFNGDGDWNDAGENIFCGVTVDPSSWPAGQNQETVPITFTIPSSGIAIGDTIWSRFRLDYNQNLNSVFGAANFGEVEDYPLVIECPEPPEEGWYYKQGYPDYCDYGIPDFDQKQYNWYTTTPTGQKWTYCGPVAVANCLWWFDSKFQYFQNPLSPPPPAISDDFPLVPQFGNWDDHAASNVRPLVQNLASFARTNVGGLGTNVDSLAHGIQHLLDISGLEHFNVFDVRVVQRPSFQEVYQEVLRSQDVILLLGFWALQPTGAWCRYGGHYVTAAGVWSIPSDQGEPWIAISDPYFDHAEGGPPSPHGSSIHNNADSVSGPHWTNWHDRYMVNLQSPSPGGSWGLVCYPMNFNYIKNFFGQNTNSYLVQWQCQDSLTVPTSVEVEYAIIMCPTAEYEDLDFGDAPDPTYPSRLLSNGARHFDYSHEWLGAGVNGESESNQVDADLFDDGVIFHPPYTPGNAGTVDLIVSVANPADVRYDTAQIYLHGWFDWNQDGDWNDVGENVFSGFTAYPNTWPAGQICDTVSISFIVPANAVQSDTFWTRFRLDYAENLNSVVGAAQFGEVEDHFLRQELPHGWYFKPPYENYAPMGMPDFDEKQDGWISPNTEAWTFCGPVAVANCFWWFDSKFDIAGTPGDGFDQCPLVRDYLDALPPTPPPFQDDHCYNNVNDPATSWPPTGMPPALPPFIPGFQGPPLPIPPWGELVERLAWTFDTDGIQTGIVHSGTNVWIMQQGIQQLLWEAGMDHLLYEHTLESPSLDTIRTEVLKSQDVILLLGFWEYQVQGPVPGWVRIGGHYVTVAGVDTLGNWIALSDPYFDQAVAGFPGRVTTGHPPYGTYTPDFHNNAQWISHDYYHVLPNSPSPGGTWYLPEYPVSLYPSLYWQVFEGQNSPNWRTQQRDEWQGGPIHTEIEYAVVISPYLHELVVVIQRDPTNTHIQLVWDSIPTSQGYKIYRSTDPNFTPSPATYITTVPKTQTLWTDPDVYLPTITEPYFYRIIVKY